jgi:hypothetical protein
MRIYIFNLFVVILVFSNLSVAANDYNDDARYNANPAKSLKKVNHSRIKTIQADIDVLTEEGSSVVENVTLTVRGNKAFREGDIFVGYVNDSGQLLENKNVDLKLSAETNTVSVTSASLRWPNAIVPFVISPLFNTVTAAQTDNGIALAMAAISANSGVQFVERTGHNNYIEFIPDTISCYSSVGMQSGRQVIGLADYCQTATAQSVGVIIHEILHALGYKHTHNRSDRDNYISVNFPNIHPNQRHNFDKVNPNNSDWENFGTYDFLSIMHYERFTGADWFVFDVDEPMLTVLGAPSAATGGSSLSSNDIASLRSNYGALTSPSLSGMSDYCLGGTTLGWEPVGGASLYRIEFLEYGNWLPLSTTTSTSKYVTISRSGKTRVLACDAGGECSLPSNTYYADYYPICY